MSTLETIFIILAVFIAGNLSAVTGEILAHLVLYRRRGQVAKKKHKRDGTRQNTNESIRFIDLIKND